MNELAKVLHYYSLLEDTSSYKIVCPFHDDVNASLLINLADNNFYCFGCQQSGNALKFVMLTEKHLDDLHSCMKYYKILKSRRTVSLQQYLKTKPIDNKQATIEAIDYYNGLSRTNWNEESPEKNYMISRGFTEKSLALAKAKINYNDSYPVIFPMFDNGEFKGWVCRTMDKKIERKRKYLYNTGFSRRSTLVGDYNFSIVVLVEGYMDWLKMRQFGLKNVAAILGWKVTANQITKLKEAGVKTIISALDNDKCGNDGTKYLANFFNVLRFQFLEGVKDPGDMDEEIFKKCKRKNTERIREEKIKWD